MLEVAFVKPTLAAGHYDPAWVAARQTLPDITSDLLQLLPCLIQAVKDQAQVARSEQLSHLQVQTNLCPCAFLVADELQDQLRVWRQAQAAPFLLLLLALDEPGRELHHRYYIRHERTQVAAECITCLAAGGASKQCRLSAGSRAEKHCAWHQISVSRLLLGLCKVHIRLTILLIVVTLAPQPVRVADCISIAVAPSNDDQIAGIAPFVGGLHRIGPLLQRDQPQWDALCLCRYFLLGARIAEALCILDHRIQVATHRGRQAHIPSVLDTLTDALDRLLRVSRVHHYQMLPRQGADIVRHAIEMLDTESLVDNWHNDLL